MPREVLFSHEGMDAPPSTRIGPGEIVAGKFRVERVLGVGGMGLVVAARQIGLERRVALKFVRASRVDADAIARFLREARAVARLRSEHVARVLDVATLPAGSANEGTPYIVMEYLDGSDLASLLRERGPFVISDAVDYLLQACEAIAEAHSRGIVHRDLKPENLFLTARVDGRPLVKVLDFGISKLLDAGGGRELALTRTADLVGSPNYMSPEQLRAARNVDARTDIWSLGVIAYELLCAKLPFRADTLMLLCSLVLEHEPAPILDLRPELPRALVGVILKCLEKDPAARFASVAELAAALEPFASAERDAAERIQRISLRISAAPGATPEARVASPHGGTDVAWAETERGTTLQKRVTPMRIALGIAAMLGLAAIAIAVAVAMRSAPASVTKDRSPERALGAPVGTDASAPDAP
jgi:serine/threonine protein kinase